MRDTPLRRHRGQEEGSRGRERAREDRRGGQRLLDGGVVREEGSGRQPPDEYRSVCGLENGGRQAVSSFTTWPRQTAGVSADI